jgi:hypothetical protein
MIAEFYFHRSVLGQVPQNTPDKQTSSLPEELPKPKPLPIPSLI